MKFRPTRAKTISEDLVTFAAYLEKQPTISRSLCAAEFNRWMDNLHGDDFFGTEGQCDPRGDHRG